MNIQERTTTILATCPLGMPPFLAQEMTAMGFSPLRPLDSGVETRGTMQDCMRMNLHLRTAHRILFELCHFQAANADELYTTLLAQPWESILDADGYISVSSSVRNDTVNDFRFANLRVKDAVVDRFMQRNGRRPDSGPDQSRGVCLFLHWKGNQATIYLDTTGEPLSKRGYRHMPHKAPMQETLAAACVLASNWSESLQKGGNFIAPMCGSGTLAIEAAQIALNHAPGMLGRDFAFTKIKGFSHSAYSALRQEAENGVKKKIAGRIIATDKSKEAIHAAQTNAKMAGVEEHIEFSVCDFRQTPVPEQGGGAVMLNPEYGKRLGEEQALIPTYKGIGDFFKQQCGGYMGYVFTGNMQLGKSVGLRTKRRIILHNAKIECRLLEYELYAGTRKNN